jgi:hypothetical protein
MNRISTRRVAAGAAALALLTGGGVLAGCGSDSSSSSAATTAAADTSTLPANGVEKLSAAEILDASLKAGNAASSVTVKGSITDEGQEISLDLLLGTDAAQGTFSAQGISAEIRVVDGKSYFKLSGEEVAKISGQGDSKELAQAISSLLGNKWIVVPEGEGGDDLGGLGQFGQKDSLLKGILEADGELTVSGTGEVNGIPVVFLDDSKGEGTLAVQTVGEPYPVQIKGDGTSGSGEINFTNWNAPVNVTAPTDVLDLSALENLGDSDSTTSSN